jgi:HSP20 family protein
MIRIRRIPGTEVSHLHRQMEHAMEGLLHGFGRLSPAAGFIPRADIHETGGGLRIIVDLAGVTREEIDITVEGRLLRVTGTRREVEATGCLRYHQMEIPYGSFERVFHLPDAADSEKIEATYRDGFLNILVPLRAPVEGRQVPIDTR